MTKSDDKEIFVRMRFANDTPISALDLAAFIFDLNRLHVIAFKVEKSLDEGSVLDLRAFGRSSFRIPKRYQLNISGIRFQSPGDLILSTAIPGLTALWIAVQIIEKVRLWPLQKEKLALEVEKLRKEVVIERSDGKSSGRLQLQDRIEPTLTKPAVRSAIKQLSSNPLKPTELVVSETKPRLE